MKHNPLESLIRLRQLAVDEARRGLADCLRLETEATAEVAAIAAAIEHETEVASNLTAGDAEVEAYAAWLRRIRPKQRLAETAEQTAEAATARARAVLAAAQAAVRAAEKTMEIHKEAEKALTERRAQAQLDEAAQRGGLH